MLTAPDTGGQRFTRMGKQEKTILGMVKHEAECKTHKMETEEKVGVKGGGEGNK
jgi:hypothetical protein